jgi:hypothetical protein
VQDRASDEESQPLALELVGARRNGFEIVEAFFQWFNFAGFLCVKKPVHP